MENYLAWVLIGFGLVIVELLTSTFYLLVLGIAAFGGAVVAYFGQSFPLQALAVGVVAAIGSWLVHLYRIKNSQKQMRSMDVAQPVVFEEWVDQGGRVARVRYRGAQWDALVESDEDIKAGATLYILTAGGNTLTVSKNRPV